MSESKVYHILVGDRALVKFLLDPGISQPFRGKPREDTFVITVVDRFLNLCYYQADWRSTAPMSSAFSAELELISRKQRQKT